MCNHSNQNVKANAPRREDRRPAPPKISRNMPMRRPMMDDSDEGLPTGKAKTKVDGKLAVSFCFSVVQLGVEISRM